MEIGNGVIHEYQNSDGAALGGSSYLDFFTFNSFLQNIENGIVMNFVSAVVMASEVFNITEYGYEFWK